MRMAARLTPFLAVTVAGCLNDGPLLLPDDEPDVECSIPVSALFTGASRDAIPALTNPAMAVVDSPGTLTWTSDDRVAGFVLDGQAYAIPLNIFWHHEIVNLDVQGRSVALTHCPLTGSSLGFDRGPVGGAEFGVSGLLFENNLVMYDRIGVGESLWPQMSRGARCGSKDGAGLDAVALVEMTWGGWRTLYPQSLVTTTDTGWDRDYTSFGNPYSDYQVEDNPEMFFPLSDGLDRRRPPKERGLGVPVGNGGIVFPFGLLEEEGDILAVHETVGGQDVVVFWDVWRESAIAYEPSIDGQTLTFEVVGDEIRDLETGSTWLLTGTATSGPYAQRSLAPVEEAFVAFWFAWPAFFPDVEVWRP